MSATSFSDKPNALLVPIGNRKFVAVAKHEPKSRRFLEFEADGSDGSQINHIFYCNMLFPREERAPE